MGPGCLSLPLGFQQAGVGLGVAILAVSCIVITLNLRSLVLCKRHLEDKGATTYVDVTMLALGPRWAQMVESQINFVQLGVCAVIFDFVAENLHALLKIGPRTTQSTTYSPRCIATGRGVPTSTPTSTSPRARARAHTLHLRPLT